MPLEQQLQELIGVLKGAVRDGSLGIGVDNLSKSMDKLSDTEADRIAQEMKLKKAEAELNKATMKTFSSASQRIGTFSKDIGIHSKLLASSFMDAVDKLDYANFEMVPETLQKHLKQTEMFSKTVIRGNADVMKFVKEVSNAAEIVELLNKMDTASFEERQVYAAQVKRLAAQEGKSLHRVIVERKKYEKKLKEGIKIQQKMNDKMRGGFMGRLGDSMSRLTDKFASLGTVIAGLTHAFGEAARPAARFGTEVSDSLTAFMAGMNPEEMAQNMAEYRQTINASGLGMDGFREVTEQGSLALTGWTGELRDAVRVQASAFGMAQRFGAGNQAQMQAFMDTQVRTFKQFNEVFSMTAEEFVQMNKQLESSQAVNEQIYRLNRQQRVQHAQEIQQTVLRLRTFGLMQEQAMKVVDAMAALGAKSPKERLKEAAKLQAVGGALGFGQAAEEMAVIMRRGMRGEGDYERFAELQKEAQTVVGQRMGEGFASEMMTAQMLETTGLEHLLGPKSDFANLNTEQYKAIQDIDKHAVKRNEILGKTLGVIDTIQSLLSGPIMKALGTLVAAGAAGGLAAGAGKLMSGLGGNLLKGLLGRIVGIVLGGGIIGLIATTVGPMLWSMFSDKNKDDDKPFESPEAKRVRQAHEQAVHDKVMSEIAKTYGRTGVSTFRAQESGFLGLGPEQFKLASGKKMDVSEFAQLSTRERTGHRLDDVLMKLHAEQKKYEDLQDMGNQLTQKQLDTLTAVKDDIARMTQIQEAIKEDKGVLNAIEKGNAQSQDQHEEVMRKGSSKSNRLIWTPVAG